MVSGAPPKLRGDLTISQQQSAGVTFFVVKDHASGAFFRLREAEGFIIRQFDGDTPLEVIRTRVQERFGATLSPESLKGFAENLNKSGLLDTGVPARRSGSGQSGRLAGNLLYLRYRLIDPSRLFARLAPWVSFFFTPVFVVFAALTILLAGSVAISNSGEMIRDFVRSLSPELVPLYFLLTCITVSLHEFGHGLTCRRFGGEVRDMGFLLIYFQPAFYCNVSDAWLFPEKSKRLWVGFAGPFFEMFLWAIAVLVWRITDGDSWIHLAALIVGMSSGIKTLFNFNPFIKLDGYYLLSDYLEIPNLRKRSFRYVGAQLRRLAGLTYEVPETGSDRQRRIYLIYGLIASCSSIAIMCLVVVKAFGYFLGGGWQAIPALFACAFTVLRLQQWFGRLFGRSSKSVASDDDEDEATAGTTSSGTKQVEGRRQETSRSLPWRKWSRRLVWTGALAGLAVFVGQRDAELRVFGPFRALPAASTEVRASVDGIVEQVYVEEGDRVEPGDRIARLSDKDLRATLDQNTAELREAQAKLRMLEAGPTPQEIGVAKAGVQSAEEIAKYAGERFERTKWLISEGVLAKNKLDDVREMVVTTSGAVKEAEARLSAVLHAVRPEQIEAIRAQIERLETERNYVAAQMEMLEVTTPVGGIVGTPSLLLKQLRRQMVKKGDQIAKVHDARAMQAEISVPEKDIAEVGVGQSVDLMVRAYPGVALHGKVTAISVAAVAGNNSDAALFAMGAPSQKAGQSHGDDSIGAQPNSAQARYDRPGPNFLWPPHSSGAGYLAAGPRSQC